MAAPNGGGRPPPEIIISVPHSGTRTLMEATGIRATDNGLWGAGEWWHFGSDARANPLIHSRKHYAHIPIRHPMNVAKSWALRLKTGDVLDDMLNRYGDMFEYLETHEATFHRMEDYPVLKGQNEHVAENRDDEVRRFQEAVMKEVVEPHREFFQRFYDDL